MDKEEYRSKLETAYQLCKEGKKREAAQIVNDLKAEAVHKTFFESPDGN